MTTDSSFFQDDKVTLQLGGDDILLATSFHINQSILHQPADFSIRLGRGSITPDPKLGPTVKDLIRKYPPNTPFELRINGHLRLTGRTDGYRASAAGGQATELTIFGRDVLAPLHDSHIDHEKSFNDATYKSLVQAVLKEVGLDPSKVVSNGTADRKLRAGVNVRELLPIRTVDEILANKGEGLTAGAAHSVLQTKAGDRWMDYLRKQLDRAGLFLWAGGDGSIILSAPNSDLAPIYRIVRRRGQTRNDVNVIHADLLNDTRPRYTFGIVYGRGGGRKPGRSKSIGDSSDDEMISLYKFGQDFAGNPINARSMVIRDAHCQNNAQAAYLAQRKLAEARRHGFQLVYTLAGLSTPSLDGGRAVWTPDTCVEVKDDEFGIDGVFWIEKVEFQRQPVTTTTIHLMRPFDVIFGTPDFEGTGGGASVQTGFKGPKTIDQVLCNQCAPSAPPKVQVGENPDGSPIFG